MPLLRESQHFNLGSTLTFEELKRPDLEFSAEDRKAFKSENFYDLKLDQERFGLLFVGPETYTIAWDIAWGAQFSLSTLDYEVLHRLPTLLSEGESVSDQELFEAGVEVCWANGAGEMQEDTLDGRSRHKRFLSQLNRAENVEFIRYDVLAGEAPFSLTAEHRPQSGECEAAVRLPRRVACSARLFQWIVDHHRDYSSSAPQIDFSASASAITRLTH